MNKQIYAIKHNVTGRIYVGFSQCPESRMKTHIAALRRHGHSSYKMQCDFDEYGEDYSFYGLEVVPDESIQARDSLYYLPSLREIAWMDRLNTLEDGYNHQDKKARSIIRKVRQS